MAKRPRKADKVAELAARLEALEGRPAAVAVDVGTFAKIEKLLAAQAVEPVPSLSQEQIAATQAAENAKAATAARHAHWQELAERTRAKTASEEEWLAALERVGDKNWFRPPDSVAQLVAAALGHRRPSQAVRWAMQDAEARRLNDSIVN